MHECPWCGQACDCDGEDTWLEAPIDCTCECGGPDADREEDLRPDEEEADAYFKKFFDRQLENFSKDGGEYLECGWEGEEG